MNLKWIGLLVVVALLNACSGKKDKVPDSVLKGIYESSGEKLVDSDTKYFIITANLDIYTLTSRNEGFYRVWKGTIGYDPNVSRVLYQYDEDEGLFESGDIIGKKIAPLTDAVPEKLRTMVRVNEAAFPLRQALTASGLELQVRLSAEEPAFSSQQEEIVLLLSQNADAVAEYLKSKNLEEIWITDGTRGNLYTQSGHLLLPAGITKSPEEVLEQIKNSPDSIDNF